MSRVNLAEEEQQIIYSKLLSVPGVRQILRAEREDWTDAKRTCKRFGGMWQRCDGAQAAIDSVLRSLKRLEVAARNLK